jgi:phospholipase C
MRFRHLTLCLLFISSSFYALAQCSLSPASPSVTICSPQSGATVSSPVNVAAGTTDSRQVTLLQIYLDGVKVYQVAAGTLNTNLVTASGTHRLTVQAKDSAGVIFKSTIYVTVSAGGGATTPLKHIVVIMMQNQSFDHLFGHFPGVNGIRAGVNGYSQSTSSGTVVTPYLLTNTNPPDLPHGRTQYVRVWDNGKMDKYAYYNGSLSMGFYDNTISGIDKLWGLADQYALADNFFASAMAAAPAMQLYMVAAADNNTTASLQPYYGPCNTADSRSTPYTFRNVGNQLSSAGKSWAWYSENYGKCGGGYLPKQNPFQYFTSTYNSGNIKDLSSFYSSLTAGSLPAVSFIHPNPGHSMHPGSGSVTTAANWLAGVVQKVQDSSTWPSTAILITWDESGGWWDHASPPQVDAQGFGARVPLIVISPYAKRGYVSHVQLDHASILRFIQWNFGLSSLNSRNALSNNLLDLFELP